MAIPFDRLLESCYRQSAPDMLLLPGSRPMLKLKDSWVPLQTDPLASSDVAAFATEALKGCKPPSGTSYDPSYAWTYFWYGKKAQFAMYAFGYPDTKAIVVSRTSPSGHWSRKTLGPPDVGGRLTDQ